MPPCPPALAYLLAWFLELSAVRGSSGFGPAPIAYAELDAWARLTQRAPLSAFEVEALRRLDRAFLEACASARPDSSHRLRNPRGG